MNTTLNALRAVLSSGRVPIGIQSYSSSPVMIEAIGAAGFDFVMIDTEHMPLSGGELGNLIRAAEVSGVEPYVRVAECNATAIGWALDLGARGVFVPGLETVEQARDAISWAMHPPYGRRGSCPATRMVGVAGPDYARYAEWARGNVLVIPIIETPRGVAEASAICAVEGIDFVGFGAGDYGQAVGAGVGSGMRSPEVVAGFDALVTAAHAHGTKVIGFPHPEPTIEATRRILDRGADVLILSGDTLIFRERCVQLRSTLEPALAPASSPVSAFGTQTT
jgi:4-hydroxy-2-oxoheptanedioate aldolase